VLRGGRLPDDQAEVVFSDAFSEQLQELTEADRCDVLVDVVRLCADPSGKHPLRAPLVGWNTLAVLGGHRRVVYKASVVDGVGLLDVLCLGPRTDNEVYDMAVGLREAQLLTPEEATDLWDALAFLDVLEEDVGLDGWDYRPPPAPAGMVRAAVLSGLLDEVTAAALSKPELEAALEGGWGPEGPDPALALLVALERSRRRGHPTPIPVQDVLEGRRADRCGALMPRAEAKCVRRAGHPGPHRTS
jgi:hypothetical protein